MAEIFKFNEGIGKIECTQEGVSEAIQQLGAKNINLQTALQNCNDEIQKRSNRINPSAMDASMKRNLEMFGKSFLKIPDALKPMLPSLQNAQNMPQISPVSISKTPEITPQNPLSAGNAEKNQSGITNAYSTLKNRDAQIRKALGE